MIINNISIPEGNICVYPYSEECFALFRYSNLINKNWKIVAAVSPKGWGLSGIELKYRTDSVIVGFSFKKEIENVDYIFIPDFSNYIKNKTIEIRVISQIFPILHKIRGVILSAHLQQSTFDKLKKACEGKCDLYYLGTKEEKHLLCDSLSGELVLSKTDIPVVAIMGMWENTDKFEVSLALREKLISNGYRVSQIGARNYCELFEFHSFPKFLIDKNLTEMNKILEFNKYIKMIELNEKPDLIILTIPGSIQQYNRTFTNYFGILHFIISRAIIIDFLILCTVFAQDAMALFDRLSTSCEYKYGRKVDAIHMSNATFDAAKISELNIFRQNFVYRDMVDKVITKDYENEKPPVLNVLSNSGVEKLYALLLEKLSREELEII